MADTLLRVPDLDRLNVRSNDILLLRGDGDVETMHRVAQDVRRALYARNLDNVTILILAAGTELSTLDPAAMAEAGWRRAVSSPTAPGQRAA